MARDFEIKLSSHGRDFYTGVLPNVDKAFERGLTQGLHQSGFVLVKTFRDGVQRQPKTGRTYSIGKRNRRSGSRKKRHKASAPGEYPAIISGDYLRAIDFRVHGFSEMEFGNSDRKAEWLEDGTQTMAPRSALIQSIDARSKDIYRILTDTVKEKIKNLNSKSRL